MTWKAAPAAPPPAEVKRTYYRAQRSIPNVLTYSRHRSDCRFAGVADRLGCSCPKQICYYRNGKLHRIAAGTCDGAIAQQKADELAAQFAAAAKGKPTPPTVGKSNTALTDVVKRFIETKTASGVTEKHVARLQFELNQFVQFVGGLGVVNLLDIRTEHILAYRNSLVGAQKGRAKKVYRRIGFFEFCVEMGWLTRNVARAQSVIIKYCDRQTPKALDDKQFVHLLDSVRKLNGQVTDQQRNKLRSLILLMRWSGLAVRDALCIERSRFEPNGDDFFKLFLRRAKTGHPTFATLRADVVEQIFAGANPTGRYLFTDAVPTTEKGMDYLVRSWGYLFSKLDEVADLKDSDGQPYHFTSHSLRHSFVSWALNHGLPTEDIATLMGDSPQIVLQHYSEWIQGRQQRLDERLKQILK